MNYSPELSIPDNNEKSTMTISILIEEQWQEYFHTYNNDYNSTTLNFCLRQLFFTGNRLFTVHLPALTNSLTIRRDSGNAHSLYMVWNQIQAMSSLLTQMEMFCQLFTSATSALLTSIDQEDTPLPPAIAPETPDPYVANNDKPAASHHLTVYNHHQQRSSSLLYEHIQQWQQYMQQRSSFAKHFSHLKIQDASLQQVDSAFGELLTSLSALFITLLSDETPSSPLTKENSVTFLLDLQQHVDQVLSLLTFLLKPLETMRKHTLPGTTIQRS